MSLFSRLADWLVPGRRRRENERFRRLMEHVYTAEDLAPVRARAQELGEDPQAALDKAWAEAGGMDEAGRLEYVSWRLRDSDRQAADAYRHSLGPTERDWEIVVGDAELAIGRQILRNENRAEAEAYANRPPVAAEPADREWEEVPYPYATQRRYDGGQVDVYADEPVPASVSADLDTWEHVDDRTPSRTSGIQDRAGRERAERTAESAAAARGRVERSTPAARGREERLAQVAREREERFARAARERDERMARAARAREERMARAARAREERMARAARAREERSANSAAAGPDRAARSRAQSGVTDAARGEERPTARHTAAPQEQRPGRSAPSASASPGAHAPRLAEAGRGPAPIKGMVAAARGLATAKMTSLAKGDRGTEKAVRTIADSSAVQRLAADANMKATRAVDRASPTTTIDKGIARKVGKSRDL